MRLTAKQFARGLDEALAGQSASQAKATIKKFVQLLAKKNSLTQADKIIKEFTKIWNERHGLLEAEITSAGELSGDIMALVSSYLKKRTLAKEITLDEKIDKDILGGVIIKYGDKVLDGSLKSVLADLKERMVK